MTIDLLVEENVFQAPKTLEHIMVTQDKFAAITQLAQKGMAKKAIARLLEIDIKTVRRHLKRSQWQPYQRCIIKKRLLDDYTDWIKARLSEVNYNASVIFQELKLMGYEGCYETVKEFVAPLRKAHEVETKACIRFETLPGEQSQVDWGIAWVWLGEKRQKIHIFSLVLGYSRRLFAKGYYDEKTGNLLAGRVSQDAMVSFNSNRYSVPWIYGGKRVDLHLSEGKVLIFIDDKEIASHNIIEGKYQSIINKEHFSGLFKTKYLREVLCPPQHDPRWNDDLTVMVRELNYYEKAAECEGYRSRQQY